MCKSSEKWEINHFKSLQPMVVGLTSTLSGASLRLRDRAICGMVSHWLMCLHLCLNMDTSKNHFKKISRIICKKT